jgi:hypothetical protein
VSLSEVSGLLSRAPKASRCLSLNRPGHRGLLKTISSAQAMAACSGLLITSNQVGRAMIEPNCDKGRGTLAQYSSARLYRGDARHPSEHANPNRGASPRGGLAIERL